MPRCMPSVEDCSTVLVLVEVFFLSWCGGRLPVQCTAWQPDSLLLVAARFLLGMGEGGAFPAATRVVAEWIEPAKRSTAMGLINAGTAIGSLLAPPIIGFVLLHSGWRAVFLVAAAGGFGWVLWWASLIGSKAQRFPSVLWMLACSPKN